MFHIVLFEPEIPPNTGNIIRLCANTGCTLHLIKPLGFWLDDKYLRRAGMDYRDMARVRIHANFDACLEALAGATTYVIETGSRRVYTEAQFKAGDALLFGPESRGLPEKILSRIPAEQRLSIPMHTTDRSLNLSNAVAVVVYEAWRQNGFAS